MDSYLTLDQFYSNIPKLFHKYQKVITNTQLKELTYNRRLITNKTKEILVVASRECMDSIVNMYVLYTIQDGYDMTINVLLTAGLEGDEYKDITTPTLFGMDTDGNQLWQWVRVPKIIKDIEINAPQDIVIVEKKKYRFGGYLQDTLGELIELLKFE